MDIETVVDGPTTVLRLHGRLTMVVAPSLQSAVDEVVGDGACVILDLAAIEFIDSSGLGAVIAALNTAREGGGDLRIAAPQPQVRTVLGLTNLDQLLPPYASVELALAGG
ncbi:MAG: STAS domain-containing protein [Sporichthyaceae bacterium]